MNKQERITRQGEILGILGYPLSAQEIQMIFGFGDQERDEFLAEATGKYNVSETETYSFTASESFYFTSSIPSSDFIRPMFFCLKKCLAEGNSLESELNRIRIRLRAYRGGRVTEFIDFIIAVAEYAESLNERSFAVGLYQSVVKLTRELPLQIRKNYFVKAVVRLSRTEFMRGLSPYITLELQREALSMVNESNLTSDDALLYLYNGVGEHFCGNQEEGARLRKKGMDYLEGFDYSELEEEAAPFILWDYYLVGDFHKVIGYYEDTILPMENKNSEVFALAYPPLIFSYFFTNDYGMAIALGERINKRAMETNDILASILVRAAIGRAYLYANELDKAEIVLRESLADSKRESYGWGLYYSLFGQSLLYLKRQEIVKSRDALAEAVDAAKKYGFTPINASPFVLDVLKAIRDNGLTPVQGFDYETKLNDYLGAVNINMSGVAYRHLAVEKKARKKPMREVFECLKKSVDLLEESWNTHELALSYIEIAKEYYCLNDVEKVRQYANLAWSCLTETEYADFPAEMIEYVDLREGNFLSTHTMLETLWLESRHMVNVDKIAIRLLTSLCRIFKMESGAFAFVCPGKIEVRFTQNMETGRRRGPQLERAEAIIAEVLNSKDVFQSKDEVGSRVSLCIPFENKGNVIAALYMESVINSRMLSKNDIASVRQFSENLSGVIATANDLPSKGIVDVTNRNEYAEEINHRYEFCQSMDNGVRFIREQISKVAKTSIPVLIIGETGVGKEVFASQVFEESNYKKAFIKVNCGAIPETLIESELFGYEKGSFTGAIGRKKGYFEMAEGGTIFLDEIGELPLIAQVKLLRVLQEHELRRIGGTEAVKVNFRLIAATNKDLKQEVEKGNFREDLYYRLNVVQLMIPPLRERKTDISLFSNFFIEKYSKELGKEPLNLNPSTLVEMLEYQWPGNVRELENAIQKAVLFSEGPWLDIKLNKDGDSITLEDSNIEMMKTEIPQEVGQARRLLNPENPLTLEQIQKAYIMETLEFCNGKISGAGGAAEILGLKRTTLISKMEKLGIDNKKYKWR